MRTCYGYFDSRPLMGCDGCSDFEACQVVTGAGDGVVAVVDAGDCDGKETCELATGAGRGAVAVRSEL